MSIIIFLSISTLVSIALSTGIHFQKYQKSLSYPLFGLTLVFPLLSLCGISLFNPLIGPYYGQLLYKMFFALFVLQSLFLKEFAKNFLRNNEEKTLFSLLGRNFSVTDIIRYTGIGAIGVSILLTAVPMLSPAGELLLKSTSLISIVVLINLTISIYTLYILENTFRFALAYQRNIARLCFLGQFLILLYQIFFAGSITLYGVTTLRLIHIHIIVTGISLPIILAGLFRYRLAHEKVGVPRAAVYSTLSLFLTGAVCLGIGATVMVFKNFGIDFSYFDRTLIIVSLCIFAILIIGSGTMRKRISIFINRYFYTQKFDYREQFNNLHRTYTTGENMDITLTDIVENMKFSLTADDAFIFIINSTDGHYHMHSNKESATPEHCEIRSEHPIIKILEKKNGLCTTADLPIDAPDLPVKADLFFSVQNRNLLFGILAVKLRKSTHIDEEDKALIEVFANSIGNVVFKNRMLLESIERKQFESFSHLSSFIIHDIKNQAATLSLVVNNAKTHISNPEFQKSLLRSIESCAINLQSLIDKLKKPPRTEELDLAMYDINAIVENVIDNTALQTLPRLEFQFKRGTVPQTRINNDALFYTIKNIVVNALDAMQSRGKLVITTGHVDELCSQDVSFFNVGKEFFNKFTSFVLISDNGHGMSKEFIDDKLFHPFSSTKDKGIGIGLYQCKSLVERMGGKILVRSKEGMGTDFCIVL